MNDIFDTLNTTAAANTFAIRFLLIAFEKLTGIEGVGAVNSYKEFLALTKEMGRSSIEDVILGINTDEVKDDVIDALSENGMNVHDSEYISVGFIGDIVNDAVTELYNAVHNTDVNDILWA